MRKFKDGDTITIEPWRSRAFPVIKDLAVDRSAYDKILQAGGFISVNTGGVPDANTIPIPKPDADESMDAAACIGCGACAATCKNSFRDAVRRRPRRRLSRRRVIFETMGDIEARVVEIFRERVARPCGSLRSTSSVRRWPRWAVRPISANPAARSGPESAEGGPNRIRRTAVSAQLYCSRAPSGPGSPVSVGPAAYFDSDPTLIRAADAPADPFGGPSIWAYIILSGSSRGAGPKIQYQQQKPIKSWQMNENRRLFRS